MSSKLSGSRKAALHTLRVARERNAYVRELLNSRAGEVGKEGLDERDAAFSELLALGVVATIGTLDEAIDRYVFRPLDSGVRDALRISAYELLFLGKEPHVAVSQGVELVKTQAKSAAGLANAVLRRIANDAASFMASSDDRRFGLPRWLCQRIVADLGPLALQDFGRAGLTPPPTFVASIPQVLPDADALQVFQDQGVVLRKEGLVPGAWRARDSKAAVTCDLVAGQKPRALVTDYSAQVVAYLAAPLPNEKVLELGSGRGTKTALMAGHAYRKGGAATFWAVDVHKGRSEVAAQRLEALGVDQVTQVMGDARDLSRSPELPASFDRVFLDAPCSGTGTLRRHPEITWSITPEDVDALSAAQSQMLAECATRVAPGGTLCYATCSVLCQENEDVVDAFLDSEAGADFSVVKPALLAESDEFAQELDTHTSPDGYLRTLVREGASDGHFCACLKRKAR